MNEISNKTKGFPAWLSITLTLGLFFLGRALLGDIGMWIFFLIGSIWMWIDSKKRDLSKLTGIAAIRKPFLWFICGIGLFAVTFPVYLTKVYETKQPVSNKIKAIIWGLTTISFLLLLYSVGSKKINSFAGLKTGMNYSDLETAMFCEKIMLSKDGERIICSVDWLKSEHSIIFNLESEKVKNMIFTFGSDSIEKVLLKIISDVGMPDSFDNQTTSEIISVLKKDGKISWQKSDLFLNYLSGNQNSYFLMLAK